MEDKNLKKTNEKDHLIDDLQKSLDINIVQQEDLEKSLNSKLSNQIIRNEDEQDRKRMEKAEKQRQIVLAKIESLQKRSENAYIKILEKQYILKQIKDLKEKQLHPIHTDIEEIRGRIASRNLKLQQQEDMNNMDGKLPNETTQEYLIRTGKITAFGTSTTFQLQEDEDSTEHLVSQKADTTLTEAPEDNLSSELKLDLIESTEYPDGKEIRKASDDAVNNNDDNYLSEDFEEEEGKNSDSDFQLSDVEVERQPRKRNFGSPKAELSLLEQDELLMDLEDLEDATEEDILLEDQDDGDEYLYKLRLSAWLRERKTLRENLSWQPIKGDNETKEWFKKLPEFKDAILNDAFKVPGEIFSKLFDYQKTCVQWLWELHCQKVGGIIGDEMGLGKTIQMISFLAALHYSRKLSKPILIVCPSTVMKQWCNEFHSWWPSFRVSILHSIGSGMQNNTNRKRNKIQDIDDELYELIEDDDQDNKVKKELSSKKMKSKAEYLIYEVFKAANDDDEAPGQVIITTYAGLKIYSDLLLHHIWGYVVLDEGHKIRNPNAGVSLTAKQLRTYNRIILSGTPIQNNLTELWSLFDFIYPGKLGTLPIFQNNFIIPINMGGYSNASNIQVQTSLKVAVALKNLISPYLLRRLKTDVAKDLPKKTELVLFCKLTNFQLKKYLDFLKSSVAESILSGKRHALYGIDILKKICNHPDLLKLNAKYLYLMNSNPNKFQNDDTDEYIKDKSIDSVSSSYAVVNSKNFGNPALSGKMIVLKTLLLLWKSEGHKILLFTQTRQMLNILENFVNNSLKDANNQFNYLRMDGTTPIKNRQTLMDDFNNKQYINLFLLTTKVGGLGVNLTGADRVIIFDPDWNPSTDIQARERAWRLGQTRDVVIYRLMTKGTIEEKIYQRQIYKQFLSNKVLRDPNQQRVFKMNQLNDLFTYGNDDDDDDYDDGNDSTYYRNPKFNRAIVQKPKKKKDSDDDFSKMAKISGVAKLETFNTGDGSVEDDLSGDLSKKKKKVIEKDEDRVLNSLLENSGILANIENDAIDGLNKHEKDSIITKEANKIADQAVRALLESKRAARVRNIGTPTWTGKFGSAGKIQRKSAIMKKTKGKNAFSSKSIIERHKLSVESGNQSKCAEPSSVSDESAKSGSAEPNQLDKQLFNNNLLTNRKDVAFKFQQFLNLKSGYFATSKELLDQLNVGDNLSDSDVKLVRLILKKIAAWNKKDCGWILNPDFRD